MGGGLMQLVAYGAQDIYLTGNPQITFFKVVYRRHTNFSMESIRQIFTGSSNFGKKVTATISRNGDLIHRLYLEHEAEFVHSITRFNTSHALGNVERYGDSLIKECELEIGGQKIDKHYSLWNRVYSDLTEPNPSGYFGASQGPGNTIVSGNGSLYQLLSGNGYGLNTAHYQAGANEFSGTTSGGTATINGFEYTDGNAGQIPKIVVNKIFIPLNFWFCRNPGLALPLIALQYHEVKIKLLFEEIGNLIRDQYTGGLEFPNPRNASADNIASKDFTLWADYIYLDTDERRRFAQVSHEYLIEQVQRIESSVTSSNVSVNLNFNHPVKELMWVMRNKTVNDGTLNQGGRNQPLATGDGDFSAGPVSIDTMDGEWKLTLNGHDRMAQRDTKYFTRVQVWQHHSGYGGVPSIGNNDADLEPNDIKTVSNDSIAVYSFALKPEEHQPSGTCNFSRIDSSKLVGTSVKVDSGDGMQLLGITNKTTDVTMTVFAVNYNVLRIMSGMGGLAYSN
jgi:hypothetical protein